MFLIQHEVVTLVFLLIHFKDQIEIIENIQLILFSLFCIHSVKSLMEVH